MMTFISVFIKENNKNKYQNENLDEIFFCYFF